MAARRLIVAVCGALAIVSVGSCGGDSGFAPAAEPPVSPKLTKAPAGRLFAIGNEPEGLVVDARTGLAAAITRTPSALTIADLADGHIVRRVKLPATGRHLALAGSGGPVLVPIEQSDELVSVPLDGGAPQATAVGDHPHDAAVGAGHAFVGNEFGDSVSVVDGGQVQSTLDAPEQPGGVAASGDRVVVVAVAERVLEVYDAHTLESLGVAPAGVGPTHVVAAGDRAWVADTEGDAIACFSISGAPKLLSTTTVEGAPYGIAVDPRRARLWVALADRNELLEFDIGDASPRELDSYPTVRQPNSVAVDRETGAAVVAGRDAGVLEVIGGGRR